ncbi:MAG TPA: carboxy-S-adenosyl-L-methionine synthase CmoA [Alphaproteobacteria bacterium]
MASEPEPTPGNVDRLFKEARAPSDFKFGRETARVFDDMVGRSVPFYGEIQRMMAEIAADFATPGSSVWDLGCASGTTMAGLDAALDAGVRLIGVDNSRDMLDKAREKLAASTSGRAIEFIEADIHALPVISDASVVVMCLTLQFVRPLHRSRVLDAVWHGMRDNGCLILVEKLTLEDSDLNRLYISYYYDLKRRNGYAESEIAQKREALENVLIPYRFDENLDLLRDTGFRSIETFFRWYNFCGLLAVK